MAAITRLGQTINTTSGTHVIAVTPTAGGLIVIVTTSTGNTSGAAPTDDQGGTYTLVATIVKAASADTMMVWVCNRLTPAAVLTSYSHAPGASTGGSVAAWEVTGMTRYGSSAIRQSAKQDNQAAATPTPVFSVAALTANPVMGVVFNETNPATMTPRSSPAYTERGDGGYATPTTGVEGMSINSGETATSIAWGSASASAFCAVVVEFDISALASGNFFQLF